MISVIISVCNCEQYLSETLDSLMSQTYKDFEVVIADYGSTDKTLSIAQKYQSDESSNISITLITLNEGSKSSAKNNGLSVATGQYLIFFDAGDILANNYLEWMAKDIEGFDADIAMGITLQEIKECGAYDISENIHEMKKFACLADIATGTKLYRSEIVYGNRIQFDESEMCDISFFLKYLYFSHCGCISNHAKINCKLCSDIKEPVSNRDLGIIDAFHHVESFYQTITEPQKKEFNYILQNYKIKQYARMAFRYTSPSAYSRTLRRRLFTRFHKEIAKTGREYYDFLSKDIQHEVRTAKKRYILSFLYLNRIYIWVFRMRNRNT